MLRAASRGDLARPTFLAAEEDRIMRAAFGRYGGEPKARDAAVRVVRHYQQLGDGSWFLCDCRDGAERPPVLVPVAETHIRRHQDQRWPVHSDSCDFRRDPAEQRAIVDSFSAVAAYRPLRLIRPHGMASLSMEPGEVGQSRDTRRPVIARLLARLMMEAGLQSVGPDWVPGSVSVLDQVKAIWCAARSIEIDAGVHLPEFLCTNSMKLAAMLDRIGSALPSRFPRSRPHGVLLVRVAGAAGGELQALNGDVIPVRGRIAMFGERPKARRDTQAERAARAPYLAACVLGRAAPDTPPEVLSAYLQPSLSDRHLMLVDSNLERHTFDQLRSVQKWLGRRGLARTAIQKPLFDIWPGDQGEEQGDARPPCLPDFIVRAAGTDGSVRSVVVETVGFADEDYRERKKRSHALMSRAVGGAPVLLHDFHHPVGRPQSDRDDDFWRALRCQLIGRG